MGADPSQIRQLLLNIISNGLKFHRKDVPPIIEISSQINKDRVSGFIHRKIDMLELTISDNGIGFDTKYLDRIFEPFQRLHGVNEFEGSGIVTCPLKTVPVTKLENNLNWTYKEVIHAKKTLPTRRDHQTPEIS